ncbi:MAG: hypothetical protein G01um10143_659 [Parcubacteria group bacterium Gr01-1014_3]|nr:MAG: hypothetical protein G01um10143_659 [Parcubacteria group bacterium Gr01-1014_3]
MPKWNIARDEYFKRLNLQPIDFLERIRVPKLDRLTAVIPLRDIAVVEAVSVIHKDLLGELIKKITTLDKQNLCAQPRFTITKLDPRSLKIGQKFVYRETYQSIVEHMADKFSDYAMSARGFSDLGAYFVFGQDTAGAYSMACYLPPIIERHGDDLVVMDGIHRNFLAKQMGITLNAIVLENVSAPFPCAVKSWSEIQVIPVADKPKALEDRYFSLRKELFRDLKYLGIDG